MSDKELADKVMARVDIFYVSEPGFAYFMYVNDERNLSQGVGDFPEDFVRDWRVAGALMERIVKDDRLDLRCVSGSWMPSLERFDACVAGSATPTYGVYLDRSNESLPRAIIEACVEELDAG